MPRFKSLRLGLVTTAVVLATGGSALAATQVSPAVSPDPIDVQTPDCTVSCSKLLQPGQRLVVGNAYARTSLKVSGAADAFGARFVIKRSTDLVNWTKIVETPSFQNVFSASYSLATTPSLFPAYFRVAAVNDATSLLVTNASITLQAS
jgi:hypothetical protein